MTNSVQGLDVSLANQSDSLSRSQGNYLDQVNVELTVGSNATNVTMQRVQMG